MNLQKYKSVSRKLIKAQKNVTVSNKLVIKAAIKANDIKTRQSLGKSILEKRVNKRDWNGLKNSSKKNHTAYSKLMNELISISIKRNKNIALRDDVLNGLKPSLAPVKDLKKTKQREQIKKALKNKNISTKKINAFLKGLKKFDLNRMFTFISKIDSSKSEVITSAFDKLLGAFIYQYYAYICALTNLKFKSSGSVRDTGGKIKAQKKKIDDAFKEFKKILKQKNTDHTSYCKQAEKDISKNLESELIPLACVLYKKKTRDKRSFDESLDNSIQTGTLIRRSILLIAVYKRFRFNSLNKNSTGSYNEWLKSASLKQAEAPDNFIPLSFNKLASGGGSYSGKKIMLKGRVLKISIRHVRRKPISTAYLTDGRYVVMATIPHIKIDSGGMAPGSYAVIRGIWKQRNKEVFNKPSLAVDRLDMTKDSKNYWMPWLSLQMNDIYEVTPHSLNAELSWKPGKDGAINQVKYSLI